MVDTSKFSVPERTYKEDEKIHKEENKLSYGVLKVLTTNFVAAMDPLEFRTRE